MVTIEPAGARVAVDIAIPEPAVELCIAID
jgi:hypothetical protein